MGKLQKEGLTKREIKKYVDELIEKNKNSYDARLAPLLYEFFLRSNKTFNWSKDEFLYKYNNFERNINTIKFAKLDQPVKGECDFDNKEIHINENMIDKLNLEEIEPYNELIDVFYHECLHATDYDDKEELKDGLFKIENNKKKTINDSMLNEYGNIIASSLISSDTGLYIKEPLPNLDGYESLHTPGTVFCAAFDISERTIAELKDKGREDFDRYFRKNYPFLKTDYIIEAFTGNLNLMHNAVESEDKEHIKEGYINIFEMGNKILKTRMFEEFKIGADEEFIEKTHYNIIKMYTLMKQSVNLLDIDENSSKKIEKELENLYNSLKTYKKFKDNKHLMSSDDRDLFAKKLFEDNILDEELLISYIGNDEFSKDLDYDNKEIANKYYSEKTEPLNNNTKLIKRLKKDFHKLSFKEKLENFKNRFRKRKELPPPKEELNYENDNKNAFKTSVKVDIDRMSKNSHKSEIKTKDNELER